jgi:endonuclease G
MRKDIQRMKLYIPKLFLILTFTCLFCLSAFGQLNDHLALGNPSKARTDLSQPNNYLVTHKGFSLSYNKERGAANWVAWHLEKSNIGKAERTNAFAPDVTLPAEWRIMPTDYTGSGYDRGHLCPSKDRSDTEYNNQQTFLMSNMQPQVPKLNQQTWKYLEDYTRELVNKGYSEAYIYAGCYGDKEKLKNKVTVPTNCFKVVVILPEGENDLKRVDERTRVIAVDMPNDVSVSSRWRTYLTTVDAIEKITGLDFLSSVPKKTQKAIELKTGADDESTEQKSEVRTKSETNKSGETNNKGKTDSSGRKYLLGEKGGCYYLTESGKKSYVDKKFCEGVSTSPENKSDSKPEIKSETKSGNKTDSPKTPAKKSSSKEREYLTGTRGGCYYLTESGEKKYVDKKYCSEVKESTSDEPEDEEKKETKPKEEEPKKDESKQSETKPSEKPDSKGRVYIKGERGGCYYMNGDKKVYVKDKSLCGN